MQQKTFFSGIVRVAFLCFGLWPLASCRAQNIPDDALQKIAQAVPAKATAKPQRARRLLVFTATKGFRHSSIPHGAKALELMGQKTGAFTTVVTEDYAIFDAAKLQQFDAICLLSTTGAIFDTPEKRKAIADFVTGGKGIIGIHAATDSNYEWPEFGAMMGGWFDGHPWNAGDTVSLRVEDPKHPLCEHFSEKRFDITDEIYQFREYSREKQRVLLGLDMTRTPKRDGMKRADNDYPVSWVKNYGKGRVFYCSLGHREDVFWNPQVLQHYLAGIQFALGDLKADVTPLPKPAEIVSDATDAFQGEYSPTGANAVAKIANLPTTRNRASVIAEGGGNYRVVYFPASTPTRIELTGKAENNVLNLSGKAGETDWTGTIKDGLLTLQSSTQKIELRKINRVSPTLGAIPPQGAHVILPYEKSKLTNLNQMTNANWAIMEDGSAQVRGGENKSKREFGDVQLHVEWLAPLMAEARGQGRANSGVYLQNRYEVQVLDSFGLDAQDNDAGGIYKVAKPRVNASLPPGQWQTYDIMFRAPRFYTDGTLRQPAMITVVHNGIVIHENVVIPNPTGGGDGDIVARGALKLQDHGNPVRFRNIWALEQSLPDGASIPSPLDKTGNVARTVYKAAQPSIQAPAPVARELFNGKDFAGWIARENTSNSIEDGAIAIKPGGGDLWTQERFGDFVLDLDFKVSQGANSGIFLRTDSIQNWLHTGIEVQVLDSHGKEKPGKHDAGAIYDVLEPSQNTMKPAGEWNHYTITAKGSKINVVLNGIAIVDMDLNNWPEAHKNPDGTPNKFNIAYKDMARSGHIGLQEHGNAVWYRNIRVRELK